MRINASTLTPPLPSMKVAKLVRQSSVSRGFDGKKHRLDRRKLGSETRSEPITSSVRLSGTSSRCPGSSSIGSLALGTLSLALLLLAAPDPALAPDRETPLQLRYSYCSAVDVRRSSWGPLPFLIDEPAPLANRHICQFRTTSCQSPFPIDVPAPLAIRHTCLSRSTSCQPPRPTRQCQLMSRRADSKDLEELVGSIDRSRKRHLEEGLLRGDLVADRLRTQEASASPVFKKTRPSVAPSHPNLEATPPRDEMALTMAEFKAYMDANTNKRLDGIEDKVSGMQAAIDRVDSNVKENNTRLKKHDERIDIIERAVKEIRQDPFPPPPKRHCFPSVSPPAPAPDDKHFDKARRSLRLWPVRGNSRDDIWNAAGIFLGTNLGLEGRLDKSSIESISRVDIPSGPGVTDEALVLFKDVPTRDLVMGSASKLAPFMDDSGRATAGMRIEVPASLQQHFRVLFKYGQGLRARHGPGTRRHVKFCDLNRTLFLNVKLPGDDRWSKVSLDMARRGLQAKETLNDDQLERRLDITGPAREGPRQRAASLAGPPPPTQASAWTRRSGGSSSS